ncbi:FosX/FosE/FosI family fosfomycin resistance hydrolase [Salinarimonas sp.]|uniref:FosX/FosE/FosI family fosfomycin resistance hydrolase n=1 Tax=Salinarimonas sp. TaxID=2766526 RepID=UPI0032D8FE24
MIEGLSHITFVVRDLARTTRLLVDGLGAEEVYASGEETFSIAREKFFLLGGVWIAAMEGARAAPRGYDHVAFKVADADLDAYAERLRALGVEIRPPRPRVPGEGRSLYFYDDDDHLFELHTGTLDARLAAYARGRGGAPS